jgi:ElaB/YqjD/DUF883 family membrane-anchored ribosome-binding protein
MIDYLNPTNQFHPYQRETSIPMSQRPQRRMRVRVKRSFDRVRSYVKDNPTAVLGGVAAVAISFGVMRARRW